MASISAASQCAAMDAALARARVGVGSVPGRPIAAASSAGSPITCGPTTRASSISSPAKAATSCASAVQPMKRSSAT